MTTLIDLVFKVCLVKLAKIYRADQEIPLYNIQSSSTYVANTLINSINGPNYIKQYINDSIFIFSFFLTAPLMY